MTGKAGIKYRGKNTGEELQKVVNDMKKGYNVIYIKIILSPVSLEIFFNV